MNLKKSLIIGASVLTLAPFVSATMVNISVQAEETNQEQVSESEMDIKKLDSYVTFDTDNLKYHVDSNAQNELSENEYLFLTEKIEETNSQLSNIELADNETMEIEEKSITITQKVDLEEKTDSFSTSLRANFSEGINKVEAHWWGYRVWLSKTTINTVGDGITLAGFFFPADLIGRVANAAGFLMGKAPGGVVFNTSPQLATLVPGTLGNMLNFWGFSFQ